MHKPSTPLSLNIATIPLSRKQLAGKTDVKSNFPLIILPIIKVVTWGLLFQPL